VRGCCLWWQPLECSTLLSDQRQPLECPTLHHHRAFQDDNRGVSECLGGEGGAGDGKAKHVEGPHKSNPHTSSTSVRSREEEEQQEEEEEGCVVGGRLMVWWRELFRANRHYRRWTAKYYLAARGLGGQAAADEESEGVECVSDSPVSHSSVRATSKSGEGGGAQDTCASGGDISVEELSDEVGVSHRVHLRA
jgi:hypothetical protein